MQQRSEKQAKMKPPVLSSLNSQEVAALKAELELELKNIKQCTYQPYECTQLTIDGFKYCIKHILQDKSAPFKQCSFVYSTNGKRCHLAAPKVDKKDYGYCSEHAVKATLTRNRQNTKFPPPQTAEVLLHSLGHYLKKPRNRTLSGSTDEAPGEEGPEQKCTRSLDPFRDVDVNSVQMSANILDFCSESDSDVETSTFNGVWHDAHNDSSDCESVDSDQEDILKHANVYTAEEISLISRDKLIKLQSLYIEQYRYLQHVFKECRRKYVNNLKREKDTCCNIYNQIRENPKEQRLFKKLKALNKYHKTHGTEAILNKRLHDQRAKITEGVFSKPSSYSKCMFTEGGVKCGERTLPLARHCRKHILEDPSQVLFKACGKLKADVECTTPVETIFEDVSCRLHMDIPSIKSYAQIRKNSESDFDDSYEHPVDNSLMEQFGDCVDVKSECVDYKTEDMKSVPSVLFEESTSSMGASFKTEDDEFQIDVGFEAGGSEGKLEIDLGDNANDGEDDAELQGSSL